MRADRSPRTRSTRLRLESLEGRDVPASIITADVSPAGVLIITGNDEANTVTVKVTGTDVTLTPNATTNVNAAGNGVVVVLPDAASSLKVDLLGGNDAFAIDPTSDFKLTGAASIKLGAGSNSLNLVTNQILELGGLTVLGGDGTDVVGIAAGPTLGKVAGAAKIDLGINIGVVSILETKFSGAGGLKLTSDSVGSIGLTATNVTVNKAVSVISGNQSASNGFTGCTIGGLTATSKFNTLTTIINSTINGNVKVASPLTTQTTVAGSTVNGNVSSSGGFIQTCLITTTTVNGNIKTKGDLQSQTSLVDVPVSGNVLAEGGFLTAIQTSGVVSTRNMTVKGKQQSTLLVGGTSTTINGNYSISGSLATSSSFASTSLSVIKGKTTVKGGNIQNIFSTNNQFKADKDVTIALGDSIGSVSINGGATVVQILGNLSISGGNGDTSVVLGNVAVTKATKIKLGGGTDGLSIENGSVFTGAFTADMGAGNDVVTIAQNTGATAEVKFNGKATILTGTGDDTLLLGKGTGGDAFSKVLFNGAGSKIDGGANINSFNDGLPMNYAGLTFGTSIVNFTDPVP